MVKYSVTEKTAFITMSRPEKRNALNNEMVNGLIEAFERAAADHSVATVIITGEGKSFCAGADLEYLSGIREQDLLTNERDSENLSRLFLNIYYLNKPVIAAVNGAAIAGGCGLASVCDFIVTSPTSKFGYSEVKIGFIPAIVAVFLIKRIGEGNARVLLLSGEIINGQRAYELGMVNYLAEDVLNCAKELSEKINNNSTVSMKLTKELIRNVSSMDIKNAVDYCIRLNALSRTTEDFMKGINSFLRDSK